MCLTETNRGLVGSASTPLTMAAPRTTAETKTALHGPDLVSKWDSRAFLMASSTPAFSSADGVAIPVNITSRRRLIARLTSAGAVGATDAGNDSHCGGVWSHLRWLAG